MHPRGKVAASLVICVALTGACADEEESAPTDEEVVRPPMVLIWSPVPGENVRLDEAQRLPLLVVVANHLVRSADECPEDRQCGHLRVFIDDDTCNAPGLPYNSLQSALAVGGGVVPAEFSLCPPMEEPGNRIVRVGLFDDAGQPVPGFSGAPAEAQISITIGP
jgi:hypothetical protein